MDAGGCRGRAVERPAARGGTDELCETSDVVSAGSTPVKIDDSIEAVSPDMRASLVGSASTVEALDTDSVVGSSFKCLLSGDCFVKRGEAGSDWLADHSGGEGV